MRRTSNITNFDETGILIGITGAEQGTSVQPYRAAIFYAGGIATASAACVLFARLRLDKKLNKKL